MQRWDWVAFDDIWNQAQLLAFTNLGPGKLLASAMFLAKFQVQTLVTELLVKKLWIILSLLRKGIKRPFQLQQVRYEFTFVTFFSNAFQDGKILSTDVGI